jgi:hypothetical protein
MMMDGTEIGLGPLLKRLQLKNSRWDWRVQRGADGRFQLLPPKLPAGALFSAESGTICNTSAACPISLDVSPMPDMELLETSGYRMGTGGGANLQLFRVDFSQLF